jgi:hypothetical protein
MAMTTPNVSLEYVSIPSSLPALVQSLTGHPNNPASLFLSVDSRNLTIYIEPTSTVKVIDLGRLDVALVQGNESALALKALLETGPTIKVFFDARMPAKTLFERCNIKLAVEVDSLLASNENSLT